MDLVNGSELYDKRENDKYRMYVTGKELVMGSDYDTIEATYPLSTQEVYTYKLSSVVVQVITVTYLTASKKDISLVAIT